MAKPKTAVVAIGGNAILSADDPGTAEAMRRRIRETVAHLADLVADGYDIALTHGNGPQVGNILLQNEESRERVPGMPLDVCGAESQAQIGYVLQQEFRNELARRGIRKNVTTLVTQVVVDEDDPAFKEPTKPIGPYYEREYEVLVKRARGWKMVYDPRGGHRRVVPSPRPKEIVEAETIRRLLFTGTSDEIVIVAGGGGVPVIRRGEELVGVEAVVDKDLASAVLAASIGETLLILLTDVPGVYRDFGTPEAAPIRSLNVGEAKALLAQGQFPEGTMGPKIEAAVAFLEGGGERAIVTDAAHLKDALRGEAGTTVTR